MKAAVDLGTPDRTIKVCTVQFYHVLAFPDSRRASGPWLTPVLWEDERWTLDFELTLEQLLTIFAVGLCGFSTFSEATF